MVRMAIIAAQRAPGPCALRTVAWSASASTGELHHLRAARLASKECFNTPASACQRHALSSVRSFGWCLNSPSIYSYGGSTIRGVSLFSHLPTSGVAAATDDLPGLPPERVIGAYFDMTSGCYLIFAEPAAQPALWDSYLTGARRSYRQHGVEAAIEYGQVRDGRSTALFVVAVDDAGQVVGGLRVEGLSRPDQAHAMREWAGRPGTAEMQAQIAHRLPAGIIEVKAVWADHDTDHRPALTAALARAFVHAMDVIHVRYALCTAAGHAVPRWQTSGGVIASDVVAVAYPDERYRTVLMWWDRDRIADVVTADQYAALIRESDLLFGRVAAVPTLWSVA